MKYARLPLADLKDLEKEFIEFLVVNGITAEEWERLKLEENDKAEEVINQFSDVIWESILRTTEMVELRRPNQLIICRVIENECQTAFIKSTNPQLNLTQEEDIKTVLHEIEQHEVSIKTDQLNKPASEYLFELIKTGFYVTKSAEYRRVF